MPDFGDDIDVKTVHYERAQLWLTPDCPPDYIYLLVSCNLHPIYRIIGWCYGKEMMLQEYWNPDAPREPAWVINQDNPILKSPASLYEMLPLQRSQLMGQYFRAIVPGICIGQVCRDMGLEPNTSMMVSVGLIMQAKHQAIFGTPPPKDNRPKTYEEGVHCMAIYPPDWRPIIEDEFRKYGSEKSRQGDLFDRTIVIVDNLQ